MHDVAIHISHVLLDCLCVGSATEVNGNEMVIDHTSTKRGLAHLGIIFIIYV